MMDLRPAQQLRRSPIQRPYSLIRIMDPLRSSREISSLISTLTVEFAINYRDESATTDEFASTQKKAEKKKQKPLTLVGPVAVIDEYARALGIEKEVTIKTAIKDEAIALLVANSYYNSFKRGVITIETSEVLGLLLDHVPGRPVPLIRNRRSAALCGKRSFYRSKWGDHMAAAPR